MTISIGTWNIKGLNSPQKRQKMWKYVIDHHLDVVALQENHLARDDEARLKHKLYPLVYKSSAATKHRGVALLFGAALHFQPLDVLSDRDRRWIMVKGRAKGTTCPFISVYAPNTGQTQFLRVFLAKLQNFVEGQVILLGDFNLTWDKGLDSTHPTIRPELLS